MVDHEPGSTHSPDNLLTLQFWYFTWNKKKSFCSVYSILFQQPSLSTMVSIAAYWWCCTPFHVYQSLGFCFKSFLLTHGHFRFAHYLFQILILWCALFIFSSDENEGCPVLCCSEGHPSPLCLVTAICIFVFTVCGFSGMYLQDSFPCFPSGHLQSVLNLPVEVFDGF